MTSLMFSEASQAAAVADRQLAANRQLAHALGERLRRLDPPFAATLARGSSDHAAGYAKYLLETQLRVPVLSHSPSIGSLYGTTSPHFRGIPLFVISQSGRSPDLLAAAEDAQRMGAYVIALVNDETSPLAAMADALVPLHAGAERSVAATKSFIASLVALLQLASCWSGAPELGRAADSAAELIARSFALDWSAALPVLTPKATLLVLGRGPTLAVAGEAALKLKESSAIHAEAFSLAEVAHGPMTLLGDGDPVLIFAPNDVARTGLADQIRVFSDRGVRVLAAGGAESCAGADILLPVINGAHAAAAPLGQIASFYRLAEALAHARGRDPDHPPFLAKVTRTL